MKKILILGSEGFIGSHLVAYFLKNNWSVYGCDLHDLAVTAYKYSRLSPRFDGLEAIFQKEQFDACINAAGNGSVPFSVEHPVRDFQANCGDTLTILEHIRHYNAQCRYVHISSAAVYGNPASLPVSESALPSPLSPYGWHKLMAEQLCKEYHTLYNMPIAVARLFSVYGPGLKKQLFWDIYNKMQVAEDRIPMWGTGKESRDFIFISDVVHAIELILRKSPMEADVYNVASGEETTIEFAAQQLVNGWNPLLKLDFNRQVREGDPLNWRGDINKLLDLGFRATVGLEQGIQKLTQWLKSLN